MDVFDHSQQSGRLGDIAIIPAASLPEAIMDFSTGLFVGWPFGEGERVAGVEVLRNPGAAPWAGSVTEDYFPARVSGVSEYLNPGHPAGHPAVAPLKAWAQPRHVCSCRLSSVSGPMG